MLSQLNICVVDCDQARAHLIVQGVRDAGLHEVTTFSEVNALARRMAELAPDLVLIALAEPSSTMVQNLALATGAMVRPVVMFVDRTCPDLTRAAMTTGLSAFVVDGLSRDRVPAVVDTAMARFQVTSQMRAELAAVRQSLSDRKRVDRAKGLLMQSRGVDEAAAYALLRKAAMDQGRKLPEVAQSLIDAADLLG